MLYETRFILALITTWCIEVPILFAVIRFILHDKTQPAIRIAGVGVLCTALTLPYLWFILPPYVDAAQYIVIGETLVFLTEAFILNRLLTLKPVIALECSFIMNLASFLLGFLLL
jgi:hypothetical protein